MSVFLMILGLGLFYFLGYRWWSRILESKSFKVSSEEPMPSMDPALRDNVDYMPVKLHLLWGHHYASIAGAAPIIGPAVAIFWGWLPAWLWVVFGTIFIGAAHDFGALVISARHKGKSMGDIAGDLIHPRVRILFQIIIYFLLWIVLTVFSIAIGVLFSKYPATIIPINIEILMALSLGYLIHKKHFKLLIPSILVLIIGYVMIAVGIQFPVSLGDFAIKGDAVLTWAIFLLLYAGVASVLPVWLLLQPRDYINSHKLFIGLGVLLLGFFVARPEMSAPVINTHPEGAPPIFPFIFVTIACGAISGFHGLVSSGTTSKQISNMTHARPIGYGGMLGEGVLALVATLAVASGLPNWGEHYHSFNENGINAISNFVLGAGTFLNALNIPLEWAYPLIAILVISFAATSMDTAARIQRMLVAEIGSAFGIGLFKNRYLAALVAVGPAIPLVLIGKSAWGPLWMLFGTTNQLIGALTLLVLFVYLVKSKKPVWYYAVPMLFLVIMTTFAMVFNLARWAFGDSAESGANLGTIVIGLSILVLEIWMIAESILILKKHLKKGKKIS